MKTEQSRRVVHDRDRGRGDGGLIPQLSRRLFSIFFYFSFVCCSRQRMRKSGVTLCCRAPSHGPEKSQKEDQIVGRRPDRNSPRQQGQQAHPEWRPDRPTDRLCALRANPHSNGLLISIHPRRSSIILKDSFSFLFFFLSPAACPFRLHESYTTATTFAYSAIYSFILLLWWYSLALQLRCCGRLSLSSPNLFSFSAVCFDCFHFFFFLLFCRVTQNNGGDRWRV